MQTRNKIGLIVLINFILPLHVILYFGAVNMYLDYAMNLSFLALLVFGSKELKTDKREFKQLMLMKIFPIILYFFYILTQVVYTFINMILGYSLDFFFFGFINTVAPDLYWLTRIISYGITFLLIFAFLLFGFSNRKYYGNYVIAFAVLYLVDRIFSLINAFTLSYNIKASLTLPSE